MTEQQQILRAEHDADQGGEDVADEYCALAGKYPQTVGAVGGFLRVHEAF